MQRIAGWVVLAWHLVVLAALVRAITMVPPTRAVFARRQTWLPTLQYLSSGHFFSFRSTRAAAALFLMALVAGILVLAVWALKRETGWLLMLIWNVLGAVNYFPTAAGPRRGALFLCAGFAVAAVASLLAKPRVVYGR